MHICLRAVLALPLLLVLPVLAASAATPDEIRSAHRDAAQKMLTVLDQGAILQGEVDQNGSAGQFEAYFFEGSWLVRERFGTMISESYSGPEGAWSGGNYSLPYRIDERDSPANSVLNLVSNGSYLEEPYWDKFHFVAEEAGGFRFKFEPDGLPPVDIVLRSDEEEPDYLQIMSAEVPLAPQDPKSIRHRSYYYYKKDGTGQLYTTRETGREIDQDGQTVNFSDYSVSSFQITGTRPEQLAFDTARRPVGNAGTGMTAPVTVPVETNFGYFLVPLTFADGTTLKFILDTGASASLFAPNAVDAADLETSIVTTAHGHGTRQEFELGMVQGASLGTVETGLVPLVAFPSTKIPSTSREVLEALSSYGCAGILGVAPLHQYVTTFDHAAKTLTFIPQQLFDPATSLDGPALTYSLDVEDLIYVKARINDTLAGQIALDTGLQQDMALLRETMDGAGMSFTKVGESTNTVIGGKKDFDYVSVPSFDLGPLRLEGKIATLTEDDRASLVARNLLGFLGLTLFQQARVTLDLFAERMYVEPPAPLLEEMQAHAPDLFQGVVDDKYSTQPGAAPPADAVPFGGPQADGVELVPLRPTTRSPVPVRSPLNLKCRAAPSEPARRLQASAICAAGAPARAGRRCRSRDCRCGCPRPPLRSHRALCRALPRRRSAAGVCRGRTGVGQARGPALAGGNVQAGTRVAGHSGNLWLRRTGLLVRQRRDAAVPPGPRQARRCNAAVHRLFLVQRSGAAPVCPAADSA